MTNANKIIPLIEEELERANKVNKPFQTPHEAYGVIKEEIEEAEDNLRTVKSLFKEVWEKVKHEENATLELERMRAYSVLTIMELIQVAAMCEKGQHMYSYVKLKPKEYDFEELEKILQEGVQALKI